MRGVGISLAEKPQKGSARGCREGFSGCSTRPWRDMPPAGWNGFPSGCQGNLWSTPPPPSPPASATTLRLHRARVKLSTRAQAHGKPHHTHCYTNRKIQRRVRVYRPSARDAYTRPANPGPRTVANGHAEFAIQRMPRIPRFFARL